MASTGHQDSKIQGTKYSGFLTPAIREWLLGEKEVSESYENKIKSKIRTRYEGAQKDYVILGNSSEFSTEELMKQPRTTYTQSNGALDQSIRMDPDSIKKKAIENALDTSEVLASSFAGDLVSGLTHDINEGMIELAQSYVEGKSQEDQSIVDLFGYMIAKGSQEVNLDRDELLEAIENNWDD